MPKRKEFSVLKWVIFPAMSLVLAGVIGYFNIQVFGEKDGTPYVAIVALIAGFSIIINKYTESDNRSLVIAAFVCEIFLTAVLIGNAAYSLSVQRKMSVARQGDQAQTESLEKISKLKGWRTQREAVKKIGDHTSAQKTFAEYERMLFWIMVAELTLFGVCAFTLFGIAKILDVTAQKKAVKAEEDEWANEQEVAEWPNEPVRFKPPNPRGQGINGQDKTERKYDSH